MSMDVKFTKHAEDMLIEREFERKLIIETVLNPDLTESGEGTVWYAIKRIGQRVLRVVVSRKKKPYIVITFYYDRRLRKKLEQQEAHK